MILFQKFHALLIVLIILFISFETSESQNLLQISSSISVEDSTNVLTSPDKTFTCGFYGLGENAYWFSIWFTYAANRTVVWTANRDRPVYERGSKVSLLRNGDMVLRDVDGAIIWSTNTTSTGADKAELLNTGNLVLKSREGKILWQSFDFPTDTLLPHQFFVKRQKLISRLGRGTFASGYFSLYFSDENVLKLIYEADNITSVYWPNPDRSAFENGRIIYNSSAIAMIDERGNFLSSDGLQFSALDKGLGIKRRLTMDYDGNLRLYSLNNTKGLWMVSWVALAQQCDVHGNCGRNGICFYAPEPKCKCPPGYEVTEPGNWLKGCKPTFNRTCSNSQRQKFMEVPKVDFWGYDLHFTKNMSKKACMQLCLDDCRCESYSYMLTETGLCFTKGMLLNGHSSLNLNTTTFIKVPASFKTPESISLSGTNHLCQETNVTIGSTSMYRTTSLKVKWIYLLVFASVIGAIEALFFVCGWWLLFRRHGLPSLGGDGYRALSSQFRRFSYAELKKATKNFNEELSRGASGVVFKGVLADERAVAVKRLGDLHQGDEEFWSEMSIIGKIYHMNHVRMWGFCSEGRHRLLVYEYVENQSLDKHLFSSDFLGWKERFKLALGTAKGLAYLHHECLEWVIHCDVKPENILLDSQFEPKIADFGLAKLSQRGKNGPQSSRIRGTKGYMAPEWVMNLPITAKVDIYSYGVVILELVKGIRLLNFMVEDGEEEEAEFTRYVRIVKRKNQSGAEITWEDIVDPRLKGEFSKNQVATLIDIGISCVEEDRSKRPTMDSVVQTLLQCEAEPEVRHPDNR